MHIGIGEAQHLLARLGHPAIARGVVFGAQVVAVAVEFHHHHQVPAEEVGELLPTAR